ncbi:MMPL family transporter [Spirillospora sp. NPDC050679]
MSPSGKPALERTLLYRLGRWCARRAWRVVIAWMVVLGVAGALVPRFADTLTGSSLEVEGSQSARAERLLGEKFGGGVTEDLVVVFDSPSRPATDPRFRAVVARGLAELERRPGVVRVQDPYAGKMISADGRTALAVAGLSGDERARQKAAPGLQDAVAAVSGDGVSVYLTGSSPLNAAVIEQEDRDLARAESIGLPIALLVLIIAFGTPAAAGLPLLAGVAALVTAFGALGAASYFTGFDVFVQAVVTMIGLALGIDYCLFAVTRQRAELAAFPGRPVVETVAATMATAGKAVLFSGCTVLISVAGLMLVRAPVFRTMALGVMVAVAAMLAVTLTLLPAVLALLGTRINRWAVPGLRRASGGGSLWARWSALVMRRPAVIAGAATLALLAAAAPVAGLKLGFDVGASAVADFPAGKGYQIVSAKFAPGAATPVQVIATRSGGLDEAGLDRLAARLRADPRVAEVVEDAGGRGDAALLTVFSKHAPDSQAAIDLVRWIRATAVPRSAQPGGTQVVVGGLTAQTVDVAEEVRRATPLVLASVLGLSFLLLLLAFRSLLLPLSAIVMNLLSVGAAFGLLTWVFQAGAGESLLDFTSRGFIQAYLPLLTFVVLFGLSMDYEVFLISRMKEEWGRTGDNHRAVTTGVADTAGVITAAAAIMVVVFASFMITNVVEVKQMGFALAVAVAVDATLIRVVLVPAFMRLAGRANWWIPAWLDRALPAVHLAEGGTEQAAERPREVKT